jgi:glutamate 5-kinase
VLEPGEDAGEERARSRPQTDPTGRAAPQVATGLDHFAAARAASRMPRSGLRALVAAAAVAAEAAVLMWMAHARQQSMTHHARRQSTAHHARHQGLAHHARQQGLSRAPVP